MHLGAALAACPVEDETGSWIATDVDYAQRPQLIPGGHGLYSTAEDYLKFQRALLGGGELDGARIMSSETVDEAFSNQIGEIDFPAAIPTADPASSADFNAGPGHKWGWGLLLNSEDIPGRRRAEPPWFIPADCLRFATCWPTASSRRSAGAPGRDRTGEHT